jgi:hypothetical protein
LDWITLPEVTGGTFGAPDREINIQMWDSKSIKCYVTSHSETMYGILLKKVNVTYSVLLTFMQKFVFI